jgi:hypothetical protein
MAKLMKLAEVSKIPKQSNIFQFEHGVFDCATQFRKAKVEQYPLLCNEVGDSYFFVVQVNGENAAYMKAVKLDDIEGGIIIKQTWAPLKFRNRGLMTALYLTLHNQGFVLVSDSQLSPESISIWKNLRKHTNGIKVVDRDSGGKRNAVDCDFDNPTHGNAYHFLLERIHKWLYSPNNFQTLEHQIFIGESLP